MKLLSDPDHMTRIVEEIIMINALDQTITDYLVITEESSFTLRDMIN